MTLNDMAKKIVTIFEKDKAFLEKLDFVSFYNKYNEEHLCIKQKNWNISISNLVSKELTDDLCINARKLQPFYEWLGERIELALNLQKGKSNEELKELLLEVKDEN